MEFQILSTFQIFPVFLPDQIYVKFWISSIEKLLQFWKVLNMLCFVQNVTPPISFVFTLLIKLICMLFLYFVQCAKSGNKCWLKVFLKIYTNNALCTARRIFMGNLYSVGCLVRYTDDIWCSHIS